MGYTPLNPQELFDQAGISRLNSIFTDSSHVWHTEYTLMNSGRRYRVQLCKQNRSVSVPIKTIHEHIKS